MYCNVKYYGFLVFLHFCAVVWRYFVVVLLFFVVVVVVSCLGPFSSTSIPETHTHMLKYCLQPSPEEIVGAVGKIAAINTAVMLKRRGRARSLTVHSLREKCSCTLHMFAAPLEIVQSDYHVSGKKNIIVCHAIRSSSLKQHIRGRQKGAHGARAATSLDVDSLSMEVRQKKIISGWICHCNNSLAEHKTVNMLRAPHCLCFSA